jgi:hypothetical protein
MSIFTGSIILLNRKIKNKEIMGDNYRELSPWEELILETMETDDARQERVRNCFLYGGSLDHWTDEDLKNIEQQFENGETYWFEMSYRKAP